MQTENSKLATAVQWTGVLFLVALAIAINGGANFYGGFILATELGMSHAAGYAVGSALAIVTLFLLGAYLTGKRGLPVIYLHIFSGCLLMFDVMHLAQMSVNAVSSAEGSIAQYEAEIADIDYQIATAEKELSGLAVTATGNNVQSLTAQINKLKNTVVQGGTVWAVSNGCAVGGYRTKCSQIATLQGELDAEIAAASGAEVTKKREEITKLRGMKTEKMGMKTGMSQKSDSAGFIAKMKPESWSVNGFLLAISMPFAVSFELFSVLAFGMLKDKLTPQKPLPMGMDGHGYGHELWAWLWAWAKTRDETKKRAALVAAAAEGKERAIRDAKLAEKERELVNQKAEISNDVAGYFKNMDWKELGKLMTVKNCKPSRLGDTVLRDFVLKTLHYYDANERILQSGDKAIYNMTGDGQKHFRVSVINALIALGLAHRNEDAVYWVSKSEAWEAIGKPALAANHSTAKAKDDGDNVIADGRPVRRRPQLRVVEVLSHKQQ